MRRHWWPENLAKLHVDMGMRALKKVIICMILTFLSILYVCMYPNGIFGHPLVWVGMERYECTYSSIVVRGHNGSH